MVKLLNYSFFLMKKQIQLFLFVLTIYITATLLQVGESLYYISLYNILVSLIICGGTIFIFAYQNSYSQIDHYFSLPLKRWKIFFAHQLAGFLLLILPAIIAHSAIVAVHQLPWFFILTFSIEKTFLYFIVCLAISLSHHYVDTITLTMGYLILPFTTASIIVTFLNVTLKGFSLKINDISYILQFINFNVSYQHYMFTMNLIVYVCWFVVASIIVLGLSYYFVLLRNVEDIGGAFPHNLIYTLAKIGITLLVILNTVTSLMYENSNILYFLKSKRLFVSLLFGYIAYNVLSLVQYRRLKNSFVILFQYLFVVMVFVGGMLIYTGIKAPLYENVKLDNVKTVAIKFQNKYTDELVQPLTIYNRLTKENSLLIEDQQLITQIEQLSTKTDSRGYYEMLVSYKNDYRQLRRIYAVTQENVVTIYNQLIQSPAYQNQLDAIFKENKKVTLVSGTTIVGSYNVSTILNSVKMYPITLDSDAVEYRFVYDLEEVIINVPLTHHEQFKQLLNQ